MSNIFTRFSFSRKITSYNKVQKLLTPILRCNRFFLTIKKINELKYLNVGSSGNVHSGYIHLDYLWNPELEICWDINKLPYPLKSNSLKGIFTEHCLEHISFDSFAKNINEFYRLLMPGGTVRIVMPDGEKYINWYKQIREGYKLEPLYGEARLTPMMDVNNIFRSYGHQFIYDFETVEMILKNNGFIDIRKEEYKNGRDEFLLIDLERRSLESLYVEATKPT